MLLVPLPFVNISGGGTIPQRIQRSSLAKKREATLLELTDKAAIQLDVAALVDAHRSFFSLQNLRFCNFCYFAIFEQRTLSSAPDKRDAILLCRLEIRGPIL